MVIDKYKNISIQDLASANVLGISKKEIEGLSLYQQRLALQKYAFQLDDKGTKTSS
ncbi:MULTISPECIES: hypothetical protein [Clostridium]|uniref:hypothetical protein n=1 Tax=Clostridium TaxID=1485 RepID=UPI000A639A9E|nr:MULTISPECIES: hypothetical protein [Clostridium]